MPLPSGTNPLGAFRLLEYVAMNTGFDAIRLGLTMTPRDRIEADMQFTSVTPVQQRIFCQRNNPGLHVELYINGSGATGYAWEKDKLDGWKSNSGKPNTTRFVAFMDGPNRQLRMRSGGTITVLDNLSAMTDAECGTNSIWLGRYSATDDRMSPRARIYYVKMWKSGTLALHLVPAMDQSGKACLLNLWTKEALYPYSGALLVAGPFKRS